MRNSINLYSIKKAVALIFLYYSFTASYGQNSNKPLFNSPSSSAILSEYSDGSDDLSNLIRERAKFFLDIGSIHCAIHFSNTIQTMSHPTEGIIFNKNYLAEIRKKYNAKTFDFILSFIIGHELGHQKQFLLYGSETVLSSSCEKRGVYESQADLIAGFYLAKYHNLRYNENFLKGEKGHLFDAMEYVYDIGEEEYSLTGHPSRIRRRNAFRNGLAFAFAQSMRSSSVLNNIDWDGNEDLMNWSNKIAKRINHFPNNLVMQLVHLNTDKEEVKYNTASNYPFVSYDYRFSNAGNRPLRVYLAFRCQGMKRSDYIEFRDPRTIPMEGDSRLHSFILNPGQEYNCMGRLNWSSVSTSDKMPHFVDPGDETSLVSVEYVDADETDNEVSCNSDMLEKAEGSADKTFNIVLEQINQASMQNFEDLKAGPGEKWESYLDYTSILKIPFSEMTKISTNLENNKATLEASFDVLGVALSPDEKRGLFNTVRAQLLKYPGGTVEETTNYKTSKSGVRTTIKTVTLHLAATGAIAELVYSFTNTRSELDLSVTPE